ncbi:HD domain-containing phosphohydrolase [Halovibrio sp. HP20-50]|uniref:HD domain-containing phosphohydrolase n=1 Tax=Halovibrio sp. HP20-59 TaxID=3080275 RepID=UPI00294B22FD|nr:HD domain-containing phosphohydrolase [Halovibrio sp. HP20-59]MEA2118237.1 PilZ domain-containing protein [Halovibrio sp. HP20-59]
MLIDTADQNAASQIIKSLFNKNHTITLFSKEAAHAIKATAVKVEPDNKKITLEIHYTGASLSSYLNNDTISFDIETSRHAHDSEEIYNIEHVPANIIQIDTCTYHLECQLPNSIFASDNRGALRVPFFLGMQARVHLEVFAHELNIKGKVRNLSIGGCMVYVSLEDSIALYVNQILPDVTLEFPNGEVFNSPGRICHMRPFGNHGHAAMGIEFINMDPTSTELLYHFVSEVEFEAALRSGAQNSSRARSKLFIADAKEKKMQHQEEHDQLINAQNTPLLRGVIEIAQQLHIILMFMKNKELVPADILYECVDSIVYMVNQDRKALKYALTYLHHEPEWVRHAIQVASQLAMILISRDPYAAKTREAVLGALIHTMGKPLLISEQLPSLKARMSPSQAALLKNHVYALENKLTNLDWSPSPTCHDIIVNANERLDGSGYPAGKQAAALSEHVRLMSVIKIINKLTHERNGQHPRQPLDAYRWVNNRPEMYEKSLLVEYIQHFGLYPIGSLAKFSNGFLAWIVDVDAKGMPCKVEVVKNLAFKDTSIDTVLFSNDFNQIGHLEGTVNPTDYNVSMKKHH